METMNRHFDYIYHYEREIAREAAKRKPNQAIIASAQSYVDHSRNRIAILNALANECGL
jgi:hypothetical protein